MRSEHLVLHAGSAEATEEVGRVLAGVMWPGDTVALHGPMGAGKTTLVRGLAAGLGLLPRQVSSPTFALMNVYVQPDVPAESVEPVGGGGSGSRRAGRGPVGPIPLVHVDAYRLSSADELETLGWDRVRQEHEGVVAVEWPERAAEILGEASRLVRLRLQPLTPEERVIAIELPAGFARRPGFGTLAALARGQDAASARRAAEAARDADLFRWMSGQYQVSRELTPEEQERLAGGEGG